MLLQQLCVLANTLPRISGTSSLTSLNSNQCNKCCLKVRVGTASQFGKVSRRQLMQAWQLRRTLGRWLLRWPQLAPQEWPQGKTIKRRRWRLPEMRCGQAPWCWHCQVRVHVDTHLLESKFCSALPPTLPEQHQETTAPLPTPPRRHIEVLCHHPSRCPYVT